MFSEKLERMISMALEDGVMEDSDRQIINKAALEEGVDLDELELYINSLVKKHKKAKSNELEENQVEYTKQKKDAIGNICPQCGNQIPPMSIKCPYCGCEVVNKKSVSSIHELLKKIDEINKWYDSQQDANSDNLGKNLDAMNIIAIKSFNRKSINASRDQRVIDTISLFPVPNAKEDIIEFLAIAASQSKKKGGVLGSVAGRVLLLFLFFLIVSIGICMSLSVYESPVVLFFVWIGAFVLMIYVAPSFDEKTLRENKIAHIWKEKFTQVLMKGRSITGDTEFQKQLDYFESVLNK